jgi:hypothetical protein
MAAPITVPAGFKTDFDYVAEQLKLKSDEVARLKNDVRSDFATHGRWIQHTAAVYRFAYAVWGKLPTLEQAAQYLGDLTATPIMENLSRCGPWLLARICAENAGIALPRIGDPV